MLTMMLGRYMQLQTRREDRAGGGSRSGKGLETGAYCIRETATECGMHLGLEEEN